MVFRDGSLACFLTRVLLPTPILLSPVSGLFLPLIFLCTASGYFLRPAVSRLLISRYRPYTIGFPPIKQRLAL